MNCRRELWKELKSLGICFILLISAISIANAWGGIAKASGLEPAGTTDANTTKIQNFIIGIINWVAGFASAVVGLGIIIVAIRHAHENDPTKRD